MQIVEWCFINTDNVCLRKRVWHFRKYTSKGQGHCVSFGEVLPRLEQRVAYIGSNFAVVTLKKNEKLQIASGDSSLKNIHVWQLHKKISGGRDAVQDYNHSGAMAEKRAH